MVQMQLKQKGKNRKLRIAKVRTKWESNILVADLFLTSGYVSAWKHVAGIKLCARTAEALEDLMLQIVQAYNPSDDLIVRIPENEYKKSVQAKIYSEGVKMTVRETYMKDYLITDCRKKELVQFCRNADNEDLIMILQAAIQSNSGLASKLFITLTEGCGYDKICTFASVPARKTDYQAYLRKALKILNDMLLLKNMPADFPAEKI